MTHPRPGATPSAPVGFDALRVISWSHRHAGFEELARVAMPAAAQRDLTERLREAGVEAALLCTCNRTELHWYALDPADDEVARRALSETVEPGTETGLVVLEGVAAARHLFRIAAGLESLLVGESEVLGQLREAIEAAEQDGIANTFLPVFFHAALRFGRRVRAETRIGQGALSVASAAVRHLAQDHADLSACTAVVLGAGSTGLKVARHLKAERVGRLVVLNRTRQRAEAGAAAIGAIAGTLDELPRWIGEADALVAAVHVEAPIVTAELLRAALAAHSVRTRELPLALVDLSLPRAIQPDCASVPGVVLHDLSGLERIVADNRALREREIPRVEEMLEKELEIFSEQARSTAARPLVAELRRRAEAIRRQEVRRLLADGIGDPEAIDHATRRIVDRILQAPSEALRRGDLNLDARGASYLRALLGLDEPETAEARDDR